MLPQRLTPGSVMISTSLQDAEIEVAGVFGRSAGCQDVKHELIRQVADAAMRHNLEPKVFAGLVAVESSCNPLAISPRGAVGLTQVMPRIWHEKYDIEGRLNLLNSADDLEVGAAILGDLVKHYDYHEGLRRYNGTGVGCDTCDGGYADRIMSLAGKGQK